MQPILRRFTGIYYAIFLKGIVDRMNEKEKNQKKV